MSTSTCRHMQLLHFIDENQYSLLDCWEQYHTCEMDLWLPRLGTHKTSSSLCILCYQAEVFNWDDKRLPVCIAERLTFFFFNITVTCCYIKYHPHPHGRLLYSHWYMFKLFFFLHPPPLPPEIVNNLPCGVYSYFVKHREKTFHCRDLHGG